MGKYVRFEASAKDNTHIRCHSILPYSIFATDASFFLLLLLDDSIRICGIDFHQMIGVETLPTIHLHFGDRLVSKIFQDICKTMDDKMVYKSVDNRRRRAHVRCFGHLQQIKWRYNPRWNMYASGSISMFVSFYCWLSLHAICLRSTWKCYKKGKNTIFTVGNKRMRERECDRVSQRVEWEQTKR